MRIGGTKRFSPDSLDALIDLYAMRIGISATEDCMQLSVSFLSDYIDTAFTIIRQILLNPRFDAAKLEKEKKIFSESIRHRFDNPGPTLDAAFQKSVYTGSVAARFATEQSVKRITCVDLIDMHRRTISPENCIFSIAGKFDRTAMIARLDTLFSGTAAASEAKTAQFPAIAINPAAKCLIVHKPISQAYVRFGVPLFMRPHADYYPVSVANLILGGGGFTSRLGTRVRSDAGLTYSIYSSAESNYTYPGTWYVEFFTKNESLPLALALSLKVIDSVREKGFSSEELAHAQSSLINEMPSMFRSPFDIVSTYAWNEYYGRPATIFRDYRDSVRSLTNDKILGMTRRYLDPSSFTYVIVGDTTAILRQVPAGGFQLDSLLPRRVIVPDSITSLRGKP
jgi:zinc protease